MTTETPTYQTVQPQQLDIVIVQGSTFSMPVRWGYKDEDGNFVPYDLTGCSVRMQIRRRKSAQFPELDLADEDMIAITDPENANILVSIPDEATELMDFRTGVYDIEVEFPGGDSFRIMEGAVLLDREVTR